VATVLSWEDIAPVVKQRNILLSQMAKIVFIVAIGLLKMATV